MAGSTAVRRSAAGLVAVVLIAAAVTGVVWLRRSNPPPPSCRVSSATATYTIDLDQAVSSTTIAAVGKRLGGGWRLLAVLRAIPRPIGDWLYDRVARNRYALFGRTEHCMLPPPEWRDRFIDA